MSDGPSPLPPELSSLLDLVEQWVGEDDTLTFDVVEAASTIELEGLIDRVSGVSELLTAWLDESEPSNERYAEFVYLLWAFDFARSVVRRRQADGK